ncbi:MAG TPA: hypothetical protein VNY36_04690 [Bacteroidia bacterium]|nr:hypothetical protein [Bacteroidia bacterium]
MRHYILKSALISLGIISISLAWTGCSSDNKKAEDLFGKNGNNANKDTSAIGQRVRKVHDIFSNLPTTVQIMQLLKKSGSHYTVDIPNDPTAVSKYSTKQTQALNLGVYAADLSFAGLFDQKDDAGFFLQSANKLSGALGIPDAFNDKIISRIENNMANQDSLLSIILSDYWTTDTYLKKNDRQEVSACLVSGGWVEGMYIAVVLANKTHDKSLANEVARQKMSLQSLADMLQTYPNSQNMASLVAQVKKLQDSFAGVTVDANSKEDGPDLLTADQLKAITDAVTAMRTQIIQGS